MLEAQFSFTPRILAADAADRVVEAAAALEGPATADAVRATFAARGLADVGAGAPNADAFRDTYAERAAQTR